MLHTFVVQIMAVYHFKLCKTNCGFLNFIFSCDTQVYSEDDLIKMNQNVDTKK